MILLLDTSSPLCRVGVVQNDVLRWHEWQADRELAKRLLEYINEVLAEHDAVFSDLSGIGVFRGPGSFTGLRIGLTVANTLADSLDIPIVGMEDEDWSGRAIDALRDSVNHHIVMPHYGAEAHITKPRK